MNQTRHKRVVLLFCCCTWLFARALPAHAQATVQSQQGLASWYGEEHRGKLMANGHKFDPDKLTAASWFYPLGTRVRVTVNSPEFEARSVTVTVTDRGPAKRLVDQGRVIDLARGAFEKIAHPDLGLISVVVEPVR
jgi:peptidoglycan lytic transglycosylase